MIHPEALAVVRALRDAGHRAYLTGGCVRDLILRASPSDFDLATSATARELRAHTDTRSETRRGARFVTTIPDDDTVEIDLLPMDDPAWIPRDAWRHRARTGDLERDFAEAFDYSVNALLYDPVDDVLHDHVDGLADLDARTLRALNDPHAQLARNKTAVVRGVILACRRGLSLEARTRDAMIANRDALLDALPHQRSETLLKLLTCGASAEVFATLHTLGARDAVLPDSVARSLHDAHLRALDATPLAGRPFALPLAALLFSATREVSTARLDHTLDDMAARYPLTRALWADVRAALAPEAPARPKHARLRDALFAIVAPARDR